MIPIAESQALAADRRGQIDYGRMRLWGSATFIAGSLGAGLLVADQGAWIVVVLTATALAATVLATTQLPAEANRTTPPAGLGDALRLLTDRRMLILLATAGLLQASHAAYYGFSALSWRTAGYGEGTIAALWSLGVVAEIVLFALAKPISRQVGPRGLLALAALGGVVRWASLRPRPISPS